MNIVYETTKERGATILMPSSMVDSLNPASVLASAIALKEPQVPAGGFELPGRAVVANDAPK